MRVAIASREQEFIQLFVARAGCAEVLMARAIEEIADKRLERSEDTKLLSYTSRCTEPTNWEPPHECRLCLRSGRIFEVKIT